MAALHPPHRRRRLLLGSTIAVGALLAGCAQFPSEHPNKWSEQPSLEPQAGPEPSIEGDANPPTQQAPPPPEKPPSEPEGCRDPSSAVVATCLDPVGAIAALPDGNSALVAERMTGRILKVQENKEPEEIARIPVDASGGGGLTGLALSPSYHEDELIYAYATTSGDNSVFRIAAGDRPKPILTGIPKGPVGNAGRLLDDGKGRLLVATGNSGSPEAANDPTSLAGKVLRIDGFGNPAPGNPDANSPVLSSGLADPGGICGTAEAGTYWVTDRGANQDSLYEIRPGKPFSTPAWSWKDQPGVAGCVANQGLVVVALTDSRAVYTMHPTGSGTFTGEPTKAMENTFGRFSAAALGKDGLLWLGTTNKDGGDPVSSDDRVLRIEPPTGGSAGKE